MKNFEFWTQIRIREEEASTLAGVDWFDILRRNVNGFVAKNKYSKAVKQLVNEVEILRQLPKEMRQL